MSRFHRLATAIVVFAFLTTPFLQAKAEENPTPTPEVFVIDVEKTEPESAEEPEKVINDYGWDSEVLETYAKLLYGLQTKLEKQIAVGICVNRYFSTEKNSDGTLKFGNTSITNLISKQEFSFYDDDNPVTKDNLFMAKQFLNERMTAVLTKQYTGFIFPSNALYFGWEENRDIAVYSSISERPLKPIIVYENGEAR